MKIFNLVYKIKNTKTEKSCAADRLIMAYFFLNKKMFKKSLPVCKYVNPLGRSYLKPSCQIDRGHIKVHCTTT